MGLIDLFKGKFVDPTYPGVHAGGDIINTTLAAMIKWGRKSSIWPMPFGTACCAIEFMAVSFSHYDIARFGAEVLRLSPRWLHGRLFTKGSNQGTVARYAP